MPQVTTDLRNEKADMIRSFGGSDRVGLLFNQPPGKAGLSFN